MLNSQLTSSTIFFLCTFKMHAKVIKQKDKYMKYCLWRGSDINNRKPPKAACPMVCKSKKKGGYSWGVLNLTTQYEAKLCIQGLCIQLSFVERRKQNNQPGWNLKSSLCPCTCASLGSSCTVGQQYVYLIVLLHVQPENPVPACLASCEDYQQWRSLPLHSPMTYCCFTSLGMYIVACYGHCLNFVSWPEVQFCSHFASLTSTQSPPNLNI